LRCGGERGACRSEQESAQQTRKKRQGAPERRFARECRLHQR
jgi:hypothetical protein